MNKMTLYKENVMLKAFIIGNLGADAEVKNSNGRDFVTFRVAHSFNSTDSNGNSTTNDYSAEFPTIQSIQIIGCKNSIIDNLTPSTLSEYLSITIICKAKPMAEINTIKSPI